MAQATFKKVSGTWKQITTIWVKVSGVWKNTGISFIKVGGIWKQCHAINLIETDKVSITMDYQFKASSDYCAVNVTPDSMSVTLTRVDTGDGIFANLSVSAATGDFSFRAVSSSENGTSPRSMKCVISDNAGIASSKEVTINQMPKPI